MFIPQTVHFANSITQATLTTVTSDSNQISVSSACKTHYEMLHAASGVVLAESFIGAHGESMAKSHAFIEDLASWIKELNNKLEVSVLKSALRDYQFALLALSVGHYRAAFKALRLTLELSFAAVYWSANERELREWRQGERDSKWSVFSDKENGILSKAFVRLFSNGLEVEAAQYLSSAVAVHRECSEYVHGNFNTHDSIPEQLVFDSLSFESWHRKASVVQLTVSFALAARYLCDFDATARSRLENMLLDHLGHSVGVRVLLGVTTEESND
jgi:hypothetical protein